MGSQILHEWEESEFLQQKNLGMINFDQASSA